MKDQAERSKDSLDYDNADLRGSRFTRVDLSRSLVYDARATEARLENVDLSGLVVDNGNLSRARLVNVNLANATIEGGHLRGLAIRNADVAEMTIDGISVCELLRAYRYHVG